MTTSGSSTVPSAKVTDPPPNAETAATTSIALFLMASITSMSRMAGARPKRALREKMPSFGTGRPNEVRSPMAARRAARAMASANLTGK